MPSDLERAWAALAAKQAAYTLAWRYYDGVQPLVYSTERLREIFRGLDARFSENWCAVVVDSTLDRLALKSFTVAGQNVDNDAATAALNAAWTATELNLDAHDVHLAALVCGEAFVIAWPDAAGQPQAYYNDPRLCAAFYDGENPRRLVMAAKWWTDDDDRQRLTLYYADRLEFYVSRGRAEQATRASALEPADPPSAANPYGRVPVFHFRRERRTTQGELANVIEPQNAINKLLADMMVAAEFGAFRQRYIISQAPVPMTLKNAPSEVWNLPSGDGQGQDTQVGQFDAADLGNYLDAIDRLATAIAVITRTPKHYLLTQGGDPSGEALLAMEAPLVRKVERYRAQFSHTWAQVGAFLLQLAGRAEVGPGAITPLYAETATVQPKTRAEIRELNVRAGLPLTTQLRDEGWTAAELDALRRDRADEAAAEQAALAQTMLRAERQFDGGQGA